MTLQQPLSACQGKPLRLPLGLGVPYSLLLTPSSLLLTPDGLPSLYLTSGGTLKGQP